MDQRLPETAGGAPVDFRALCAELLDEVAARPLILDRELINRARAALAQPEPEGRPAPAPAWEVAYAADVRRMCDIILGNTFGNEELDSLALLVGHYPDVLNAFPAPVPVAEGEMAELALKELEQTVVLLMPVTGHKKIKRFDTIRAALKRLHELENKADLSPAPPAPAPAGGEVAELAAKLRRLAPHNPLGTADPTITRAADLLERQAAPVPVAVSGWQPISTAPKDGTEILASDCLCIDIVSYEECERGVFGWTNRELESMSPIWWHPLPDYPPLPSGEVES